MCGQCSGLPTGIYTTSKPDACQFVANNCSANVICVEDEKQLAKILQVKKRRATYTIHIPLLPNNNAWLFGH